MFDPETRAAHLTMARDTAMGPVVLHVRDLDGMTAYYRDVLTLQVIAAQDATVVLGRGGRPLVELRHGPALATSAPGQAGLFHTAILFESPAALAGALLSVARRGAQTYTGAGEHLVSQAFYMTDPRATASSSTSTARARTGGGSTARSRWPPSTWTRTSSSPPT